MIITDEKILRQPCEDVKPEEVGELRELLERELENSARLGRSGVGLSLPQVNIHKKMAIIRLGPNDLNLDLVNCSILKGYDLALFKDEGCLSFPGRAEDTMRYQEIVIGNNLVYPTGCILTGLMAICAQHELDHLNGILLPDRAQPKSQIKKVGPNNPCPCGIIDPITQKVKKYKKCHGK